MSTDVRNGSRRRTKGIERVLQVLLERQVDLGREPWETLDPELAQLHLDDVKRIAARYREIAARIEAVAEGRTPSTCPTCTERFHPLRSDARFCSARCRVAAHRASNGSTRNEL